MNRWIARLAVALPVVISGLWCISKVFMYEHAPLKHPEVMHPLPMRPEAIVRSVPQKVHWVVSTEPAGAEVLDSDFHTLGRTPWSTEQVRRDAKVCVQLHFPGYVYEELCLDYLKDQNVEIPLRTDLNWHPPAPQPHRPESLNSHPRPHGPK